MRQKYIDEAVGAYIVFGKEKSTGRTCVHDAQFGRDIFFVHSEELAQKIVDAQQRFLEELYELLKDERL